MALDPQLLPYVDVAPRVGRSMADNEPGIGLGSPRYFRFTPGMSMNGPDWQLTTSDDYAGWTVKAQTGFMQFTIPAHQHPGGWISASIREPFTNLEGSVSVGFRIRLNSLLQGPLQLLLTAGVVIVMNPDGTASYTIEGPSRTVLAISDMKPDGQWRDILVSVTPTAVAVWEGEEQKFVQPVAVGASFSAMFQATVPATPGMAATFDIGDVVVVSGTDKNVRPSRGLLESVAPAQTEGRAMATALQTQLTGLQEAATPLAQLLNSADISWWDWFWGRDVDPAMQQAVNTLVTHPKTRAYLAASEAYRGSYPSSPLSPTLTLCLSVGITITAVVSAGSSLGLNIDLRHGTCQLVVSANGGLATNISIGFAADVLFFPRGLSEALGWFFYTKASGGEGVTMAIGIAGGIPVQFPGPGVAGNIGLNLAMGIGAGVVPIDVGGGVSYSWPLS